MLASNENLRMTVRSKRQNIGEWTDAHTHQLGAFLRYYLNDALATQNYRTYAPAVGRAVLVSRTNLYLIDRLSKVIDDLFKDLYRVNVELPALHIALIILGKGEPLDILEAAIGLRSRTAAIRKWLSASLDMRERNPGNFFVSAESEISDIKVSILEKLHVQSGPLPVATVDAQGFHGTPSVSADPVALTKWYQHWRRKRRYAVLTEMCTQAVLDPNRDKYIKKFRSRCFGHS